MPSTPGFPSERPNTQRRSGNREYESFDSYESGTTILPAGVVFTEVITFGGRPDSIEINCIGGPIEVRLRNRGMAAPAPVNIPANGTLNFRTAYEIVEARDPAGAGAQRVTAIGRYPSRHIDVRQNPSGPRMRHATSEDFESSAQSYKPE
jgi:hypothetical protein